MLFGAAVLQRLVPNNAFGPATDVSAKVSKCTGV